MPPHAALFWGLNVVLEADPALRDIWRPKNLILTKFWDPSSPDALGLRAWPERSEGMTLPGGIVYFEFPNSLSSPALFPQ